MTAICRALTLTILFVLSAITVCVAEDKPATADTPLYEIRMSVDPAGHSFDAALDLTLPEGERDAVRLLLHSGLGLRSLDPAVTITELVGTPKLERFGINEGDPGTPDVPLTDYEATTTAGGPLPVTLRLAFGGKLHHAIEKEGAEYARSFSQTPGIISDEGVFLSGSSFWLPQLDGGLLHRPGTDDRELQFQGELGHGLEVADRTKIDAGGADVDGLEAGGFHRAVVLGEFDFQIEIGIEPIRTAPFTVVSHWRNSLF